MGAPIATDGWLDEVVGRLVTEFDPLRIMVFGSRARGDGREYSDLDLLVVLPQVGDRQPVETALRRAVAGAPVGVDVFATDPDEIERTGDSVGSFLYPVLREGEVLYGVDERNAEVWLRFAEEDLQTAERMLAGQGFAVRWACYLAQEAAEKAIKAVLVAEGIRFPFVHELQLLRDLVPGDKRLASVDVDLGDLARWATVARYPGREDATTDADAREAVAAARLVLAAASEDVPR
jgi:HEPN domain-containing protein